MDTYAYTDPNTGVGVCQSYCPSPYYESNLTKQCVDVCPDTPVKTYAQDNGRKCVYICEDGKYGNNFTKACESDCTAVTDGYADETTNLCVTTCPLGFFAYAPTHECLRAPCPGGFYADPSTRTCVDECPGTERYYADPTTFTCVLQCPGGTYGDSQLW